MLLSNAKEVLSTIVACMKKLFQHPKKILRKTMKIESSSHITRLGSVHDISSQTRRALARDANANMSNGALTDRERNLGALPVFDGRRMCGTLTDSFFSNPPLHL